MKAESTQKKAFRIKKDPTTCLQMSEKKIRNKPSDVEQDQLSLLDQIKNKFNEQKYMKREDVMKVLKELQQ